MLSRKLAIAIILTTLAGCLGIGPHYAYLFQHGDKFSNDVLPYAADRHFLAVHAKGRPGWYVLMFDAPEGEYDRDFSTASAEVKAWYFPPLAPDSRSRPDEIYAPDLEYFVDHCESPQFAKRAVRLEGTLHIAGEGDRVKNMELDLKSADESELDLKGTLRLNFHPVRLDVPKLGQ